MAPWAKAYTGDIDEVYTELALEKIENEPTGPEGKRIDDYKELFKYEKGDGSVKELKKSKKSKKILMKGVAGNGKTTLAKKVAYDWAKGIFTAISIVFFVSMKLVKPGDAIENIIIRQTPLLQGISFPEQKLKNLLEVFGHKCLIILDGWMKMNR